MNNNEVNLLISLIEFNVATWLCDQSKLGPKTIDRLVADILFSSSLANT